MVLHEEGDMIGPGWVMRDISEIKQGSFGSRKSRETTYDPLKEMAASDPKYKYYKRLMPKPRERQFQSTSKRSELEENYRNPRPRGLDYETSDKGHSLMQKYLQDLPREKVTSLSTDLAGLKKDLKEAAKKETEELKSKIKPNSAHKVYAWRHLLEEKESKSQAVSCVPVPSEVYLPDKTNQLLTVFHKEHITDGKVRNRGGYWQIPRLGPLMTRDKNGLKILDNLEMEEDLPVSKRTNRETEYHYCWPLTDPNTGDSIQSWVKQ